VRHHATRLVGSDIGDIVGSVSAPDRAVALPHPGDDPVLREAQQQRLSELREKLEDEGADGRATYEALRREAETWPE
jgi:hypothetical protein